MRQFLLLVIPSFVFLAACQTSKGQSQPAGAQATPAAASRTGVIAPAGTPASQLPPDVSDTLHHYTLDMSDLPDGYSTGLVVEVPNAAAISGYDDLQAAQAEMTSAGRQGGLGQQIFPPGNVATSIGVSVELFQDAAGAQQWASQPPALPAAMSPTPANTPQPIGDAMSVTHWTQGGQSGYILSFSQGRVVFGIGLAAPTGQESLDPAITLAQVLDQKAQQQSS